MAERTDEAAFAVIRVGGALVGRPFGPAVVLVAVFAAVAGIGWTGRESAPDETRPAPTATARPQPTPQPVVSTPPANAAAGSIVLGGRHPDREQGTDGMLGGIVFRAAATP